jgi:hypothetical protein
LLRDVARTSHLFTQGRGKRAGFPLLQQLEEQPVGTDAKLFAIFEELPTSVAIVLRVESLLLTATMLHPNAPLQRRSRQNRLQPEYPYQAGAERQVQ